MGGNAPPPAPRKALSDTTLQAAAAGFTIGRAPSPTPPTTKKKKPKKKTPPTANAAADPQEVTQKAEPMVWSRAGTAQLRARLSGSAMHPTTTPSADGLPPPEPALLAYFTCATKPANLRRDGDQRLMTKLEADTFYAWMSHRLHLAEPPQFITETYTAAERDSIAEFDRKHLGFRLYGVIPAGFTIPETGAKYHLCHAAVLGTNEAKKHQVLAFFNATHTITIDPKSMIMEIRFVQPTVRDTWDGFEFALGKGVVRLQATDSLTTDIPKIGFDPPAQKLLYHVYFYGGIDLAQHAIRAIGPAAAGMPVLHAKLVQSIGMRDFHPTRWKLTFDQITCPGPLERVRRLQVVYDNALITVDVHHPRSSRRAPCSKCLSIRHPTKDCKTKFAGSSAASRTLNLEVAPADIFQLTAAISPKKLGRQMKALREAAAPELARSLEAAEQRRLHKLERKTKAAAKQAAKEAAAEVRAQLLARAQVARDRKKQARQQTLQAHKSVRAQLHQVQQHARATLKSFGGPTASGTTQPQAPAPPLQPQEVSTQAGVGHEPETPSAASPTPTPLAIIPYVDPSTLNGKRQSPPSPTASDAGPPASKGRQFSPPDDANPAQSMEGTEPPRTTICDAPQAADPKGEEKGDGTVDGPKPTARRTQKQLPLSAFFAPQTLADAQAQLEQEIMIRKLRPEEHWQSQFPSPLLDALLNQLLAPCTLDDWRATFRARIAKTPSNGGCLQFAVHGCRARYIRGEEMFVCRTTVHEGNHYKDGMCTSLLEYLSPMLADDTVTLADFNRRFFRLGPPEDEEAALRAIRRFIEGIRDATLSQGLTRDQWGADEDIFGLVWYLREPIIVIAEDGDTQATTVRIIRLERHDARGPECILQLFPGPSEAFEIVRTFLRHRVLPTILVFRPNSGNGHFDSFRFHESLYKEWTSDDKEGLAMRARMDQVLVALGWYVAPPSNQGIPKCAPVDLLSDSDSTYLPSATPTPSPSPVASPGILSPVSAHALTSALNPRRRRRGALAQLWHQAEAANLVAYRQWDNRQDDCAERDEADTVNAGCEYWSRSTSQLVALLRSLPYPEVALSLLPPSLLLTSSTRSPRTVPSPTSSSQTIRARHARNGAGSWPLSSSSAPMNSSIFVLSTGYVPTRQKPSPLSTTSDYMTGRSARGSPWRANLLIRPNLHTASRLAVAYESRATSLTDASAASD